MRKKIIAIGLTACMFGITGCDKAKTDETTAASYVETTQSDLTTNAVTQPDTAASAVPADPTVPSVSTGEPAFTTTAAPRETKAIPRYIPRMKNYIRSSMTASLRIPRRISVRALS